jgi:DMSO/TMAO reductase YedYZ molybdopterin-dependent catalytic subunit
MSKHSPLSTEKDIDLFELYAKDPELADRLIFGRLPHKDRRGFLRGAGLAAMGGLLGAAIPFHRNMPSGFIPEAFAATAMEITGKNGLTVLNDRPVNAETPAHLLDDDVTPTSRHFIRNNGIPPEDVNPDTWSLTIDGLVDNPLKLSIADLKDKFEVVSRNICIECGGNGRAYFDPKAKGNQWSLGAVACAQWTGVRLVDVLKAAGVKNQASYTAHYGSDTHLSGKPGKLPISRGVPIEKAMDSNNLITFAMNGEPIHPMNGAPLRLQADPSHERGAASAPHSGLAGLVLPQMVQPDAAPRRGARRAQDDGRGLSLAAAPGGPGHQGGVQGHGAHRVDGG